MPLSGSVDGSVTGEFLAARPRQVTFTQGRNAGKTITVYQCAFIPGGDPHKFPAVANVTERVFNQLLAVPRGQVMELGYIVNQFNEERTVTEFALVQKAAV